MKTSLVATIALSLITQVLASCEVKELEQPELSEKEEDTAKTPKKIQFNNPYVEKICDDSIDNDKDSQLDCHDIDCLISPLCLEYKDKNCDDGIDNDLDGQPDCEDPDCAENSICSTSKKPKQLDQAPDTDTKKEFEVGPYSCSDGIDNDKDGKYDCLDDSCFNVYICLEGTNRSCSDGIDNDKDGKYDCLDDSYFNVYICLEGTNRSCSDGIDNDKDGKYDCLDDSCQNEYICLEGTDRSCSDGLDNDKDCKFDCDDPGCMGVNTCHSEKDM